MEEKIYCPVCHGDACKPLYILSSIKHSRQLFTDNCNPLMVCACGAVFVDWQHRNQQLARLRFPDENENLTVEKN